MSEELKEILEFDFKSQGERIEINKYERDILKDYITNLQQYYNDNVNKYEELLVKYSDLQEENERLNNIIDELEKWLKEYMPLLEAGGICEEITQDTLKEVSDKLKELKGERK